jgi:predicted ATP-dependent endonuclease of OLD family
MITRFRLENFKAHRDTDLALRQFTVLVGENSSGKTSVLEALRFPDALDAVAGASIHTENLGLDDLLHRGAHHMQLSMDGTTRSGLWPS